MTTFDNRKLIVQALVGSYNYNLNTKKSDKDYKYFVAPSFRDLYSGKFYSAAKTSDELDYSVHDIRKLSELVWKANINFVEVLFTTEGFYDNGVKFLFEQKERWAAMNLQGFKNATFGTHIQKMGNLHKGTEKTKNLVEKWGYDTKEACHALRCLYTLEQYAQTQKMESALRFNGVKKEILLSVKRGDFTEPEFNRLVMEWRLKEEKSVNDFFASKKPDNEAKAELDEMMYKFIKSELLLDKNE